MYPEKNTRFRNSTGDLPNSIKIAALIIALVLIGALSYMVIAEQKKFRTSYRPYY